MKELEVKLQELKNLETRFSILSDRLGQDDERTKKIKLELDQAKVFIFDLMLKEQEKNIKRGIIA